MLIRPHDLIWLNDPRALQGDLPAWVASQWRVALPLVVRRDALAEPQVPVGVRGLSRDRRAAGWVERSAIQRLVSPEMLVSSEGLLRSPFVSLPPVQGAVQLADRRWPWQWGITGGTAYALVTEVPVLHAESDLDLLIRAPQPLSLDALMSWQQCVSRLPCRADTQVETPSGAFALSEWLRDARVMLKTNHGPRLTSQPWQEEGL